MMVMPSSTDPGAGGRVDGLRLLHFGDAAEAVVALVPDLCGRCQQVGQASHRVR